MYKKKIHQGDVLLIPVIKIPVEAKKTSCDIVQSGEITGHAHRLEGCEVFMVNENKFIFVKKESPMRHEDHPEIIVPAGNYEVRIQEEYFPDGNKKVVD